MSEISFLRTFISLLLLTLTIFLAVPTYYYYYHKKSSCLPHPPGPKPWPVVGCLPQAFYNKPSFRWIQRLLEEMNTDIACIRLGSVHLILVTSPDMEPEFLKKNDRIFASRPDVMSSYLISDGYLTTDVVPFGEQWMKMRKILSTELLSLARHRWLHDKRAEEADHVVRYIYNQCCGTNVRALSESRRRMEGPAEDVDHLQGLSAMQAHLYAFCLSDYLPFLRWIVDLDGHEKGLRRALQCARKYHDPEIDERIREWRDGTKKVQEDLLDVLINVDQPSSLSPKEIKAQVVDIFIATMDNESKSLEWALAEMMNQPELLQSATEELDRVVGKDRLVQEHDLPKLNYIKACVKEAFRLHPMDPFNLPHVSVEDTVVAGYFIPRGSHLLLCRKELGRNPKVWEEPLAFKPTRHMRDGEEVVLTDHELNMITFSTGRRGCPGITLGSTITWMLFARVLQAFTWHVPPPETTVDLTESHTNLSMAKPLCVLAKPRLAEHLYSST